MDDELIYISNIIWKITFRTNTYTHKINKWQNIWIAYRNHIFRCANSHLAFAYFIAFGD